MKKHAMRAIYYIGISFTTVSALLIIGEWIQLFPYDLRPAPLELLVICALLSGVQVLFDRIPEIKSRRFLRILMNLELLFLLGSQLFGWFHWDNKNYGWERGLLSLAVGAVASILAYIAGSLYIHHKMRKDAEKINLALKKRNRQPLGETNHEKDH